jgi:hypothetical protein
MVLKKNNPNVVAMKNKEQRILGENHVRSVISRLVFMCIYVYRHICLGALALFTGTRRVRVRNVVCDLTMFGC